MHHAVVDKEQLYKFNPIKDLHPEMGRSKIPSKGAKPAS